MPVAICQQRAEPVQSGRQAAKATARHSGTLLSIFNDRLRRKERFIGVRIDGKEDVYPALKQFFGRLGVEV